MTPRYEVKPAQLRYGETTPTLWFIRDTSTDELVQVQVPGQRPGRLRSYNTLAAAQRAVKKLNGAI